MLFVRYLYQRRPTAETARNFVVSNSIKTLASVAALQNVCRDYALLIGAENPKQANNCKVWNLRYTSVIILDYLKLLE